MGELLWASPTSGPTISLAYIPPGTQCLIHLRPRLIIEHPEGERLLAALGPWGQSALKQLSTLLGGPVDEVESLLIAVVVRDGGQLGVCLRATGTQEWSDEELARRFPDGQIQRHEGREYRVIDGRAHFIEQDSLIVCPADLATELIDSAGESPPLVRDMERLLEHSDADRAASVMVVPRFLQASGNELLVGAAAPLHDALYWLAGRDAAAIMLSAHWDDNFFAELRAEPTLNVPPRRLAAKLHDQIRAASGDIEETVVAGQWPPYGRKVLARFPGMLRALARYSRAGEADRQAVVRAYLPAMAGHNLLMATELLLTQPRLDEVATSVAPASPMSDTSFGDRLDAVCSLTFSKETLERAIELLAEDAGLEITIQGADLQLEGITKNQSLALDLRDRPVREILLEILLRANPDRTAAGPADPRQKLVYAIEPEHDDSRGRIIVTTRAAAERRGERLPDVFLLKDR